MGQCQKANQVVWEKPGHPYVMTNRSVAYHYVINSLRELLTERHMARLNRNSDHSVEVHSRDTRHNGDADRYMIRASRREQVSIRSKS